MTGDLTQVVNEATPYVVAAAGAYGGSVLEKAQQEAAEATVGVGRRPAQRIFGVREKGEPVPEALADVIDDPDDADDVGALRKAIRKALTAWRDGPARASVVLVHWPGGQGKTRLAGWLANDSHRQGWAVAQAVDRPAGRRPGAGRGRAAAGRRGLRGAVAGPEAGTDGGDGVASPASPSAPRRSPRRWRRSRTRWAFPSPRWRHHRAWTTRR